MYVYEIRRAIRKRGTTKKDVLGSYITNVVVPYYNTASHHKYGNIPKLIKVDNKQ